jgi:hypothetical protein
MGFKIFAFEVVQMTPTPEDFQKTLVSISELHSAVESSTGKKPEISIEFQRVIDWMTLCSKPYVAPEEEQFDYKDIYMKKGDEIIGLHAIGHAGPYEYDLVDLDGSTTPMKSDFITVEKWGNNYDHNLKMIGRGSFRIHDDIEIIATQLEEDGWVRFKHTKEAP